MFLVWNFDFKCLWCLESMCVVHRHAARPRNKAKKKNGCVALSDQPISKYEIERLGSRIHPIFVRLGVFSPFLRKRRWKMHPNFVPLGALKKLKKKIWLTDPISQKFHLRATQQFFFLWPNQRHQWPLVPLPMALEPLEIQNFCYIIHFCIKFCSRSNK